MDVRTLSDSDLLLGTQQVLGSRRQLTAKLLSCLGEIEARSLYLKEAYSSMYDYCVSGLSMSEGEAHRTLTGARVVRRFPDALRMVRDGRLHLSGLELLQTHLTQDNHAALLEAACGKTKRQIEELVRAHFPRPDVPDRIQALLAEHESAGDSAAGVPTGPGESGAFAPARAVECIAVPGSPASHDRGDPRLRPLSAERFHVQFTASREFRDKLERVQDFMRHQNPRGDLEPIFDRAVDLLVADLEKKRLAKTERPRRARAAKYGAISRAARREVFERDGEHCAYVSPSGRRCTSRAFIELDHNVARALGGSGEPRNLRVRCGAHNRFEAKQLFGEGYVNDKIEGQRQNRCNGVGNAHGGAGAATGVDDGAERSGADHEGITDGGHLCQGRRCTAPKPGHFASGCSEERAEQIGTGRAALANGGGHLCQRRYGEEPGRGHFASGRVDEGAGAKHEAGVTDGVHLCQRRYGEEAGRGTFERCRVDEGAEQTGAKHEAGATGAVQVCQRRHGEQPRRSRVAASPQVPDEATADRRRRERKPRERRTRERLGACASRSDFGASDFEPLEASACGAVDHGQAVVDLPRTECPLPGEPAVTAALTPGADHLRQEHPRSPRAETERGVDAEIQAKLVSGLTNMGFRAPAARRAVDALSARPAGESGAPQLDMLFREALAILTS